MLAFRRLSSRKDFVFEPEALADLQNRLVANRLTSASGSILLVLQSKTKNRLSLVVAFTEECLLFTLFWTNRYTP